MQALIGTRKATVFLRLAIVLTLVGSVNCERDTTALARNESVCFLIDGQIYCIPGTGGEVAGVQAGLELSRLGVRGAPSKHRALAIESSQRGEAAAARHGRAV